MATAKTTPIVHLDLDAEIEKGPEKAKEPFRFSLRGRVIEMLNPDDQDWRDLMLMEDPRQLLRLCLSAEDRTFLYEQDGVPARVFNRIMEGFNAHYGLADKIAQARRRQQLDLG